MPIKRPIINSLGVCAFRDNLEDATAPAIIAINANEPFIFTLK